MYRKYFYVNKENFLYYFFDSTEVNYVKSSLDSIIYSKFGNEINLKIEKYGCNVLFIDGLEYSHNKRSVKSSYKLKVANKSNYEFIEYRKYNPPLTEDKVDIILKEVFVKKLPISTVNR